MPKLRRLAGRDLLTILQGFGFLQVSQRGSHVKLAREVAGTRQVLTVPLHAELDPGTLRAIFRQASDSFQSQNYVHISTRNNPTRLAGHGRQIPDGAYVYVSTLPLSADHLRESTERCLRLRHTLTVIQRYGRC